MYTYRYVSYSKLFDTQEKEAGPQCLPTRINPHVRYELSPENKSVMYHPSPVHFL